jgi:hypothetical protein
VHRNNQNGVKLSEEILVKNFSPQKSLDFMSFLISPILDGQAFDFLTGKNEVAKADVIDAFTAVLSEQSWASFHTVRQDTKLVYCD